LDSIGTAYVNGNLIVTGAKQGYVADLAQNGTGEVLRQGEPVSIIGVRPPAIGNIPVIVVGPARRGRPVIGVVDRTMVPHQVRIGGRTHRIFSNGPGAVKPGGFLFVVTLGAFAYASVDATNGAIRPGASLQVGRTPGTLVAERLIRIGHAAFLAPGTSVGYALGTLRDGTGRIGIFVSPH
jgi:hypothetical protein